MAEAAALSKHEYAEGIVDLVKAFETAPHHILADLAKTKGYCLVILRLCLAAYCLDRAIGVDGTSSGRIRATRGTTARVGIATSELRLLLADVMAEVTLR